MKMEAILHILTVARQLRRSGMFIETRINNILFSSVRSGMKPRRRVSLADAAPNGAWFSRGAPTITMPLLRSFRRGGRRPSIAAREIFGLVLVLLSSSGVAPAHAQSEAAAVAGSLKRILTLAEAKRLTFRNNWDLLAARSDVDLATAQRIVAREFPNPTLTLSSSQ